jgi:hypothetical protein
MNTAFEQVLHSLQRDSFSYFLHEADPVTGLVADKNAPDWPASIAATGFGLAALPTAIERGFITRSDAVERGLRTLRFLFGSTQGTEPDATGYRGFYYHFLDMRTGRRARHCELSTVDSAFLLAGALLAAMYFDGATADERELRALADALYRRADWHWAQNGGTTLTHGWKPGSGFLRYRWSGYDEALLLYALALGSPTHPATGDSYAAWCSTYRWTRHYDYDYLYSGPLFTHQLSHIWIDFRGIQDAFMRHKGIDYFENSRRATYVQQQYAIRNPCNFAGYSDICWGISASDGPGPRTIRIDGRDRRFYDYVGRGVPLGPDDGTLAPWAVVASLPFAPELVLPTIEHFLGRPELKAANQYGFRATFNATFADGAGRSHGWVSPWNYGLNQGPIVLMIENYRSGLSWRLMSKCSYLTAGLRRAGFLGGWL